MAGSGKERLTPPIASPRNFSFRVPPAGFGAMGPLAGFARYPIAFGVRISEETLRVTRRLAEANELFFELCEAYNDLEAGGSRVVDTLLKERLRYPLANPDLYTAVWMSLRNKDPERVWGYLLVADDPTWYLKQILNNNHARIETERDQQDRFTRRTRKKPLSLTPGQMETVLKGAGLGGSDSTSEVNPHLAASLERIAAAGRRPNRERAPILLQALQAGWDDTTTREAVGGEHAWRSLKTAMANDIKKYSKKGG